MTEIVANGHFAPLFELTQISQRSCRERGAYSCTFAAKNSRKRSRCGFNSGPAITARKSISRRTRVRKSAVKAEKQLLENYAESSQNDKAEIEALNARNASFTALECVE